MRTTIEIARQCPITIPKALTDTRGIEDGSEYALTAGGVRYCVNTVRGARKFGVYTAPISSGWDPAALGVRMRNAKDD